MSQVDLELSRLQRPMLARSEFADRGKPGSRLEHTLHTYCPQKYSRLKPGTQRKAPWNFRKWN